MHFVTRPWLRRSKGPEAITAKPSECDGCSNVFRFADDHEYCACNRRAEIGRVDRVDVGLTRSTAPVPEAFTEAKILGQRR